MVRGCQKKIIYLKNIESRIFDEAYFIVKDNSLYENKPECDMVKEANRILDESLVIERRGGFYRILGFLKVNALPFLAGGIAATVITLIFA